MQTHSFLIADDSAAYRHQLRQAVEAIDGLRVIGEASSGRSVIQFMSLHRVDCLILSADLPAIDAKEMIKDVRKTSPLCKILLLAANTGQSSQAGADGVAIKSKTDAKAIRSAIEPKINALFAGEPTTGAPSGARGRAVDWRLFRPKVIVVGSSTGGPDTLEKFLLAINGPLICPMIIVQHMPAGFTATLAARLSDVSGRSVVEAKHGQLLTKQQIVVAPGDYHLRIKTDDKGVASAVLDQSDLRNFVRPAVDHLFESAAVAFGQRCLGIVLTGMGQDGLDGAKAIKAAGGAVVIQDKASSVVFGMPAAVQAGGYQDFIGDPNAIGGLLNRIAS